MELENIIHLIFYIIIDSSVSLYFFYSFHPRRLARKQTSLPMYNHHNHGYSAHFEIPPLFLSLPFHIFYFLPSHHLLFFALLPRLPPSAVDPGFHHDEQ
jgi:hypothetical protein